MSAHPATLQDYEALRWRIAEALRLAEIGPGEGPPPLVSPASQGPPPRSPPPLTPLEVQAVELANESVKPVKTRRGKVLAAPEQFLNPALLYLGGYGLVATEYADKTFEVYGVSLTDSSVGVSSGVLVPETVGITRDQLLGAYRSDEGPVAKLRCCREKMLLLVGDFSRDTRKWSRVAAGILLVQDDPALAVVHSLDFLKECERRKNSGCRSRAVVVPSGLADALLSRLGHQD